MNKLAETIGEICKVVLPIKEEFYIGNPSSDIAICTLSSLNLLRSMKNPEILSKVGIIGRLLSENKGIDELIRYVNNHQNIKKIIICGKEVWGHKSGHSLIQLHQNGMNFKKRIIGSTSPEPILTVNHSQVKYFQKEITLINLIGKNNLKEITKYI